MSIEDASPMVLEPDDYCTIVVSLELGRFPSLWDQPKIFRSIRCRSKTKTATASA
jgi:hypothetical protein